MRTGHDDVNLTARRDKPCFKSQAQFSGVITIEETGFGDAAP